VPAGQVSVVVIRRENAIVGSLIGTIIGLVVRAVRKAAAE